MWQLDDPTQYEPIHKFSFLEALTYSDNDPAKRVRIRSAAAENFPLTIPPEIKVWAFRIHVGKAGKQSFNLANVSTLIVNAFSKQLIAEDEGENSPHTALGLFEEGSIDYVRVIEVGGTRSRRDETLVEIFGGK